MCEGSRVMGVTARMPRFFAADATVLLLITTVPIQGQLPEEPVVKWLIRWDSSADTKCCPGCPQHHFTELRERPLPEAAPPSAGRRQLHILPKQTLPLTRYDRLILNRKNIYDPLEEILTNRQPPTSRPLPPRCIPNANNPPSVPHKAR